MSDQDLKREVDEVVQEFKEESEKIIHDRAEVLHEIRKELEEEKIKEIKSDL